MTLIDFTAAVGPVVGIAVSTYLLLHLTSLPFWAVLLIALPVGGILGVIGGIGFGMLIAFGLARLKQR